MDSVKFLSEKQLLKQNSIPLKDGDWIAALDEAGRGCLFGPVTVGMTLLPLGDVDSELPPELQQIRDSKMLTPRKRESLFPMIREHFYGRFSHIAVGFIEKYNINRAVQYGVYRLVRQALREGYPVKAVLVDGNYRFDFPNMRMRHPLPPIVSVVKGDQNYLSIAAASIMAKVARDRLMMEAASRFPVYRLERHKGYGTKAHVESIIEQGISRFHRQSFLKRIVPSKQD